MNRGNRLRHCRRAGRRSRSFEVSPSLRSGYRSWHASLNETIADPPPRPHFLPCGAHEEHRRHIGRVTASFEGCRLPRGFRVAVIHHVVITGYVRRRSMPRASRPIGAKKAFPTPPSPFAVLFLYRALRKVHVETAKASVTIRRN